VFFDHEVNPVGAGTVETPRHGWEDTMRKWVVIGAVLGAITFGTAAPAFADSVGHTGPPAQSCQDFSASTRPGNSASSPGSPFNEAGINSANGGTGGANYSESSQYDVACFQWNAHH
jgi:hypothetical protein